MDSNLLIFCDVGVLIMSSISEMRVISDTLIKRPVFAKGPQPL